MESLRSGVTVELEDGRKVLLNRKLCDAAARAVEKLREPESKE